MSTPSKNVQIIVNVAINGLQPGQMVRLNPDTHKSNYTTMTANNFPLPPAYTSTNVNTLNDILNLIPSEYYQLKYQAAFVGTMDPDNCGCDTFVQLQINNNTYQTIYQHGDKTITVNSPSYVELTDSSLANIVPSSADVGTDFDNGLLCVACPNKTMYSNAYVYLRAVILIDMYSWCTMADKYNIQFKPCYDFIGNWCSQNGGCDQPITTYLQKYCTTLYPDKDLDLFNTEFDSQDFQICACNMPTADYTAYQKSIQDSVVGFPVSPDASCVFVPCKNSNFKSSSLNGCPGPQCVQAVILDGNDVQGNVTVDQEANCGTPVDSSGGSGGSSGGSGGGSGGSSGGSGGSSGGSGGGSDGSGGEETFFSKYKWIILIVVVILLLILCVGGFLLLK
jgi:hypothetical protein